MDTRARYRSPPVPAARERPTIPRHGRRLRSRPPRHSAPWAQHRIIPGTTRPPDRPARRLHQRGRQPHCSTMRDIMTDYHITSANGRYRTHRPMRRADHRTSDLTKRFCTLSILRRLLSTSSTHCANEQPVLALGILRGSATHLPPIQRRRQKDSNPVPSARLVDKVVTSSQ